MPILFIWQDPGLFLANLSHISDIDSLLYIFCKELANVTVSENFFPAGSSMSIVRGNRFFKAATSVLFWRTMSESFSDFSRRDRFEKQVSKIIISKAMYNHFSFFSKGRMIFSKFGPMLVLGEIFLVIAGIELQ